MPEELLEKIREREMRATRIARGLDIDEEEGDQEQDPLQLKKRGLRPRVGAPSVPPLQPSPPTPPHSTPLHNHLRSFHRELLAFMQPGETVMKCLRRYGDKQRMKTGDGKKTFERITEISDDLLTGGDVDIHSISYERLAADVAKLQAQQAPSGSAAPSSGEEHGTSSPPQRPHDHMSVSRRPGADPPPHSCRIRATRF